MISVAIALAISLAFLQGAIAGPRSAFMACLKQASLAAETQKISPDQYRPHALQTCAAQVESFKQALVNFDMKNGIKRARAAGDAQLQVDDYVGVSTEKYQSKVGGAPR